MITIDEDASIREVLEVAEDSINVFGYDAVVVETDRDGEFEGTLFYVPGIRYKELKEACNA